MRTSAIETIPTFDTVFAEIRPNTLLSRIKCRILFQFARYASEIEGSFVELGVFNGGTSLLIQRAAPNKQLYALDTFCGIPASNPSIDFHQVGEFAPFNGRTVIRRLKREGITPVVGHFPATSDQLPPDLRCAMAHFDGDTYESCRDFLTYFYPRTTCGGVIILDDYRWKRCRGVEKAVKEFLAERIEVVMQFAPRQAVIIKV